MVHMPAHRVAVIGCGVAGSFAALLLQRQGHRVTVFEQAAGVPRSDLFQALVDPLSEARVDVVLAPEWC